nr:H/ACA ribonucleoprotein complex subunit 4-like [Drosophila suzukii]
MASRPEKEFEDSSEEEKKAFLKLLFSKMLKRITGADLEEDASSSEEASLEEASLEEAPLEEAPLEEAPLEEAPLEEAPMEEAPLEEAPSTSHRRKKKKRLRKYSSEDAEEEEEGSSTSRKRKRKKKRRKKSKSSDRARMPVEYPEIDEPLGADTTPEPLSPCGPVLEPSAEEYSVEDVDLNGVVEPLEAEGPESSMASQEKSQSPPSEAMVCVVS